MFMLGSLGNWLQQSLKIINISTAYIVVCIQKNINFIKCNNEIPVIKGGCIELNTMPTVSILVLPRRVTIGDPPG